LKQMKKTGSVRIYRAGFDVPRGDNGETIRKAEAYIGRPLTENRRRRLSRIIDEFRANSKHRLFEGRTSQSVVHERLARLVKAADELEGSVNSLDDVTMAELGAINSLKCISDNLWRLRALAKAALRDGQSKASARGVKTNWARTIMLRDLIRFYKDVARKWPIISYTPSERMNSGKESFSPFMGMVFAVVEASDSRIKGGLSEAEKGQLRKDAGKLRCVMAKAKRPRAACA
jgi:hypothetical protein